MSLNRELLATQFDIPADAEVVVLEAKWDGTCPPHGKDRKSVYFWAKLIVGSGVPRYVLVAQSHCRFTSGSDTTWRTTCGNVSSDFLIFDEAKEWVEVYSEIYSIGPVHTVKGRGEKMLAGQYYWSSFGEAADRICSEGYSLRHCETGELVGEVRREADSDNQWVVDGLDGVLLYRRDRVFAMQKLESIIRCRCDADNRDFRVVETGATSGGATLTEQRNNMYYWERYRLKSEVDYSRHVLRNENDVFLGEVVYRYDLARGVPGWFVQSPRLQMDEHRQWVATVEEGEEYLRKMLGIEDTTPICETYVMSNYKDK
jgi:hypothetical protein